MSVDGKFSHSYKKKSDLIVRKGNDDRIYAYEHHVRCENHHRKRLYNTLLYEFR